MSLLAAVLAIFGHDQTIIGWKSPPKGYVTSHSQAAGGGEGRQRGEECQPSLVHASSL